MGGFLFVSLYLLFVAEKSKRENTEKPLSRHMVQDEPLHLMKRYEIIDYFPDTSEGPAEEAPERYARPFVGLANYTSGTTWYRRETDIYVALELVVFRHLELPGAPSAEPWIQKGFDGALHYFFDDWKADVDPDGYNMVVARQRRDKRLQWYRGFSRGLILGLLSNRWAELTKFCCWPWAGLVPEYSGMGSDLEDEVALIYIVVAAGLRDEPMEGLARLKTKIRKCRAKRPRLLMNLWDAVEAGDQTAFGKAMKESLQHRASLKRSDPRDGRMAERLGLPQTAIGLAAMRRGLQLPELPEKLAVYLITRRSLGLEA